MIDSKPISNFTYYKVVFNGNLYEIINKVFDHTEAYIENLPTAIGQAKAYDSIISDYVEEGVITFENSDNKDS